MIVEDAEAFKSWLTCVLKPICEADPAALAKYVFALVKKDKTPDVLRPSMVNQLEVFLQGETASFVDLLFKTLESREYLTPVIPSTNPPNPNITARQAEQTSPLPKEVRKEIIPVNELPNLNEAVNGSAPVPQKEEEPKRDLVVREPKKSEGDRDDKPRRRSRHRSLSRNRSRSRSWDRARRSRSREKSRERDLHRDKRERLRPLPYRGKSSGRRYDRRRSLSPSPIRGRSRSRSPRYPFRGRYRNRSPPPRSLTRSRSRSPKDRKEKNDKELKDSRSGAGTPTQDSNHGESDVRLTSSAQSIKSVVVHHNAASPKKRCRDYDEKGFCMRGEMCPYDHGVDPVVLEDSALTGVLSFAPNGAPIGELPPPMMGPPRLGHMPPRPLMHDQAPYNPQAPQMWHRPGFRGPRPMLMQDGPIGNFGHPPNMQRELIPVPVMDQQGGHQNNHFGGGPHGFNPRHPPYGGEDGVPFKKRAFDYSRLGPRSKNPANCSLELKKVPPGLNNITHLNNHFSKFGKIVNIQVSFEGDPEAAIVTFSSHAEANAAYRSTEAVLNNRFIKVFWHSNVSDGKQENIPPRPVKDRLGPPGIVAPNTNKVLNLVQPKADEAPATDKAPNSDDSAANNNSISTAVMDKEEAKQQTAAAIRKGQELLAAKEKLRKNQEEKKREAMRLSQNLTKRKQELLEKQLAQQKLLIDKMEKTQPGPQRDLLLQTIKKSQEATEAIRKDMMLQQTAALASSRTSAAAKAGHRTKKGALKEALDAELDLIARQQEGADTAELQKRVLELKARVMSTPRGGLSARGRRYSPVVVGRHLLTKNNLIGDGAATGAKPGLKTVNKVPPPKHIVDHRPTRVLVSGYESDEQEAVLVYFSQFGEIVDYVSDPSTPSIVFNYKTRKEAEVAMLKGKHFQDRTLSITWCNNAQLNTQLNARSSTRTVLLSQSEEDHLIEQDGDTAGDAINELSEEILLQDDEEEDEDSEARSWRR